MDVPSPTTGRSAHSSHCSSTPPARDPHPERATSQTVPPASAASAGQWPEPVVTAWAENRIHSARGTMEAARATRSTGAVSPARTATTATARGTDEDRAEHDRAAHDERPASRSREVGSGDADEPDREPRHGSSRSSS